MSDRHHPDPLLRRLQRLIKEGRALLLAERPNVCHLHDFTTGRPLVSRPTGKPRSLAAVEQIFALLSEKLPSFYYVCLASGGVLADGSAATLEQALAQFWLPGPLVLLSPKECQARGWAVQPPRRSTRDRGARP